MTLRAIPEAVLCPHCGQGRLISYGSNSTTTEGPHKILVYRRCDRCGELAKTWENRVGIEPPPKRDGRFDHVPDLFDAQS